MMPEPFSQEPHPANPLVIALFPEEFERLRQQLEDQGLAGQVEIAAVEGINPDRRGLPYYRLTGDRKIIHGLLGK